MHCAMAMSWRRGCDAREAIDHLFLFGRHADSQRGMNVWWAAAGTGVGIIAVAVVRLLLRAGGSNTLPPVSDQWLAHHKRDRSR